MTLKKKGGGGPRQEFNKKLLFHEYVVKEVPPTFNFSVVFFTVKKTKNKEDHGKKMIIDFAYPVLGLPCILCMLSRLTWHRVLPMYFLKTIFWCKYTNQRLDNLVSGG